MTRALWILAAAWVGFSFLAFELVLAQLLLPLFGDSVWFWPHLIAVFLGLAAGTHEFLAPRLANWGRAGAPLALAISGAYLVWLGPRGQDLGRMLRATLGTSHGFGLPLTALILALPALLGLAGFSPVATQKLSQRGLAPGLAGGLLQAASMLGSVAGTLLPGLVLLPLWGTARSFEVLGLGSLGFSLILAAIYGSTSVDAAESS